MKRTNALIRQGLTWLTFLCMLWGVPWAIAQSQTTAPPPNQDSDFTTGQLASFDRFLDSQPDLAQQLRKDPSLIDNQQFVESHPALQQYLQGHPQFREEFDQNPNAFMRQEQGFDRRTDRAEVVEMDEFLDKHPEIAQQVRKNPSLVSNEEFIENHPALQEFLKGHPQLSADFQENPNAFMHQEDRYDRRDNFQGDRDLTRGELAGMDRFLDGHPEIAEQLRKNPALIDDKEFVTHHPALHDFLSAHPGVREEFEESPNAFMHQEERFDRGEGDRDVTRRELASMDRFLDGHPEIAEQLRKNPVLIDDKEFVTHHPALHDFLNTHPGVREEFQQNPNAFMHMEQRFDRREGDATTVKRDRDVSSAELSSFNEFLEGHSQVAGELSKNPSLAKNEEYLEGHPELQQYLKAHPEVHEELNENPQSFLQFAQQFDSSHQARSSKALPNPK